MSAKTYTIGQQRVRLEYVALTAFQRNRIDSIKGKFASLIDEIELLKAYEPRCASIAQTEVESALHWVVKAITHKKAEKPAAAIETPAAVVEQEAAAAPIDRNDNAEQIESHPKTIETIAADLKREVDETFRNDPATKKMIHDLIDVGIFYNNSFGKGCP